MDEAVPTVPRRWNVTVEGIKWLPRLVDKARMSANGTLGNYLIGHSPVDFALLRRLAIATPAFVIIATERPDDAGVLAALRGRGFDEARVRNWSDRFETTYRAFIPLWDVDEGYRQPSAVHRALIPLVRAIEGPATMLVRNVLPLP
jgi:hypothetical protein